MWQGVLVAHLGVIGDSGVCRKAFFCERRASLGAAGFAGFFWGAGGTVKTSFDRLRTNGEYEQHLNVTKTSLLIRSS